jgi:hypothetical protein
MRLFPGPLYYAYVVEVKQCEDFARATRTSQPSRASGEVGLEVVRILAATQNIPVQQ